MRYFLPGMRVRMRRGPLQGMYGTVRRPRVFDHGAWVTMDKEIPGAQRTWKPPDARANDVLVYLEEVELLEDSKPA